MKIVVAGTGYVGLVAGVCFAEKGHNVTCVDTDKRKVELMEKGISPIYEKDLEELMRKNYRIWIFWSIILSRQKKRMPHDLK